MFKKRNEAIFKIIQSHPGLCIWTAMLITFGGMLILNYCNVVYIGQRAFICKIIERFFSLSIILFFSWGLISIRIPKTSASYKRNPRLFQYGRIVYVILIVGAALCLSYRTAHPVISDIIQGPESAVVTYVGTDSEYRKAGRHGGSYTLYHLHFKDSNGRQITINLTNREFETYHEYFESLNRQKLTFYPHTHVALIQ